jgi:hypothetical protein
MQSTEVTNVEYLEALHDQGAWELAKRVAELEAILAQHQRLLASGVLYTPHQLDRRDLIGASNELERAYRIANRKYKNGTVPLQDLLDRALELRQQADRIGE